MPFWFVKMQDSLGSLEASWRDLKKLSFSHSENNKNKWAVLTVFILVTSDLKRGTAALQPQHCDSKLEKCNKYFSFRMQFIPYSSNYWKNVFKTECTLLSL